MRNKSACQASKIWKRAHFILHFGSSSTLSVGLECGFHTVTKSVFFQSSSPFCDRECPVRMSWQSQRPRSSISLIHQRISPGHCSLSLSHSKMHAPSEYSDPHAQTPAPTFLGDNQKPYYLRRIKDKGNRHFISRILQTIACIST